MKNPLSVKVEQEDKEILMSLGKAKFIRLYPERKNCPPNHIELYGFVIREFLEDKFVLDKDVVASMKRFIPELFVEEKDG